MPSKSAFEMNATTENFVRGSNSFGLFRVRNGSHKFPNGDEEEVDVSPQITKLNFN